MQRESTGMELVLICQDGGLHLGNFIGRMLTPSLYMQFSNRRFVLQWYFQRAVSSQDQNREVIKESWKCLCMFYLDPGTILNQGDECL
jgi:hypothetical protein